MARRVVHGLGVVVLFLSSTLVFWGILQNNTEFNDVFIPDSSDPQRRLIHDGLQHKHPLPPALHSLNIENNIVSNGFKVVPGGTSPELKPPKTNRIWPNKYETEDRILPQINLVPDNPDVDKINSQKVILLNSGFPSGVPIGDAKFKIDGCPVRNCFLTDDRERHRDAAAIVYDSGIYHEPHKERPRDQIWVIFMLESPENVADLRNNENLFNWTATYRLDSTINTPYERFILYANHTGTLPKPKRNYAEGKTKMAAWFVSNCYATNKRGAYARELQRYMSVDIYGSCGNMSCFRSDRSRCNEILNRDYKFYLAFENSNCKDYITEKFYWNGLYNDIIPVVMGAPREDYAAVAPPGSYIHVDDFESPRYLAEYLKKLDQNDTLYNEYFRWKGTGKFIDTKYWCRLCSMVHESHLGKAPHMWYQNIQRWWSGPGVCISPRQNEGWASWRTQPEVAKIMTQSISGNDTLIIEQ